MKTVRSRKGPFAQRPHFKLTEIEEICTQELRSTGLYPDTPQAIRIERFIEKRFVTPTYEPLPEGILGFTKFGARGVEEIVVAAELGEEGGKAKERRLRTTLAHEGGHGLLHAHLFSLGTKPASLFAEGDDAPEILCRDVPGHGPARGGYDGRWWEFQANKAIGGLLLPRGLVYMVLKEFSAETGFFGQMVVAPEKEDAAVRALSDTFDVNPMVARIRLADVMPRQNGAQLSF